MMTTTDRGFPIQKPEYISVLNPKAPGCNGQCTAVVRNLGGCSCNHRYVNLYRNPKTGRYE